MSTEAELGGFLDKFEPTVAATARSVLEWMRARIPGAVALVYDNYNALAIGFGAGDRVADAVFSIAVFPRWVTLVFTHGVGLDDPAGLLRGEGNQVRNIRLVDGVGTLERPEVQALLEQALALGPPIDPSRPNRLVIKSVSAKQRPRRPTG